MDTVFEGDVEQIIKALLAKVVHQPDYGHVLQDTLVLASDFWVCMVTHVKCVSNFVAHFLARRFKSGDELQVWLGSIPDDLAPLVSRDVLNFLFLNVIWPLGLVSKNKKSQTTSLSYKGIMANMVSLFMILNVCLASLFFANLFYYLVYFCYYLWVSLYFLVLFMGLTILFQLTFTFIYNTFSKKCSVLAKCRSQTDHKRTQKVKQNYNNRFSMFLIF